MRKYRVGDSPLTGAWLSRSKLLYFFFAWNAFGICAYQWWKSNRKTISDDQWKQMTSSQKYMSLMSRPDDELQVVRVSGFQVDHKKNTNVSAYAKPEDIPPPPPVPEKIKS